jgi:hypothetical protein
MPPNSTRRTFLAGSASAVLAAATAEQALAGTVAHDAVSGSLATVTSADTAVIELAESGVAVRVRLAAGAEVLSGRTGTIGADLTELSPGEPVVLRFEGPADPAVENAVSMVQSLVGGVVTTVLRANDTSVQTADGDFLVAPSRRGRWSGLRGRARITYWQDPASGARYANAVHPTEGQ